MSLDTGLSELIKRIYSAAGDPAVWDEIIVEIFQRVRCCAGISVLLELPQLHLVKCRIYGPPHVGYCVEEYSARYKLNPTLIWASKNRDKRFCDSRAALEPAEYQSHPFVTWAAETFGASFWITGFTAPTSGAHFCLSPFFPDDSEDRSEDLKLFRLLFDHVECALRLRNKPFSEESARALIRLSDEGAVENTSRGARRMLEQQSAIYICNDRLCSAGYLQQNIIDRTVEKIITSEDALRRPTAVQIKHDRGRPWIVVFRPVTETLGPFGRVSRKVDVELLDRIPAMARLDVIQSLFDLTGRELQVLRLLAHGHSIDSLSATIEISRNTTRTHLRSIYAKTRTSSQVELMQLCSGLNNATSVPDKADLELLN